MMWIALLLSVGCGPKTKTDPVSTDTPPILPAPEARLYATGQAEPRDPIVAAVVGQAGLPWQESLAGAATYLALHEPFTPELALARWGAVRAGYPHPVRAVTFGTSEQNTLPTALVEELVRVVAPGEELGLIRARAGTEDRWVALIGQPRMTVAPLAREYAPGDWLEIPGDGHWRLQSPEGNITEGALPARVMVVSDGEWWLELRRRPGGAPAVAVPLYVGISTPPAPILPLPGQRPDAPAEAIDAAYDALDDIRAAFNLPQLGVDPTLETLAGRPLREGIEGAHDPAHGTARLRAAGFVGGPAGQVYCEGRTVALCMDSLMWDIDSRQQLLQPGLRLMGADAEVRTSGVSLLLNVASE